MRSAKDIYIQWIADGNDACSLSDELLCQMMDEEREALELQHDLEAEQDIK